MTDFDLLILSRTFRAGDTWAKSYLCTEVGDPQPVYDEATLLVQVRTRVGDLIATSSEASGDVIQLVTDGTDLNGESPILTWKSNTDTSSVNLDDIFYLEAEVRTEDGDLVTLIPKHRIYVIGQVAYSEGS